MFGSNDEQMSKRVQATTGVSSDVPSPPQGLFSTADGSFASKEDNMATSSEDKYSSFKGEQIYFAKFGKIEQ